ncbi:MAG: polyprenyl diphosphate synthase [bacterium]
MNIPKHVAIILDGNGRWAKAKGLSRSMGHKAGSENLNKLAEYILKTEVEVLSVFAFSTENFKRSEEEVSYLMNLFTSSFKKDKNYFNKCNIKVVFSGRDKPLSDEVMEAMDELMELTKDNTGGIFNICLNYGGQAEIVDASKKITNAVINKEIQLEEINEETFSKYLYNELPQIDLMIRTSGETRISNFMLYALAYAELYFTDTYFPDFDGKEYEKAIESFNKRDRRFGGIKDKK